MALNPPKQQRSVDPFSDNRYSSVINRLSRIATGGVDCILNPHISFQLTRLAWNRVRVSPGICVKDDVLIHIMENYDLYFDNNDYYVDQTGDMESEGYYYIVLKYEYGRMYPVPKASYHIIRNVASLYNPNTSSYIFLGTADVRYNTATARNEVMAVYHYDPSRSSVVRPSPKGNWLHIDGGEI